MGSVFVRVGGPRGGATAATGSERRCALGRRRRRLAAASAALMAACRAGRPTKRRVRLLLNTATMWQFWGGCPPTTCGSLSGHLTTASASSGRRSSFEPCSPIRLGRVESWTQSCPRRDVSVSSPQSRQFRQGGPPSRAPPYKKNVSVYTGHVST